MLTRTAQICNCQGPACTITPKTNKCVCTLSSDAGTSARVLSRSEAYRAQHDHVQQCFYNREDPASSISARFFSLHISMGQGTNNT